MATEYQTYLGAEWDLFAADVVRHEDARRIITEVAPRRVLDVGCGGGQDLIPFADAGVLCFGLDIARESAMWASARFQSHHPQAHASFVTGAAEGLPFAAGTFELVLCRLAIPYADNAQALAEISRVLCPRGGLVLKTHTLTYYLRKFREGFHRRSPLFSVHAARVVLSGFLYELTGRQPRGGVLIREVFQSERLLRKELGRVGLRIQRELSDSSAESRTYWITKS